jgi:uncharacterized protein YaiI (UPF0178 family)
MTASWTVSTANDTAMTAYIAMRLAQDNTVVTKDQAIAELLLMAGIDQSVRGWSPIQVKQSGNRFHA